jgi:N-acetylneuraminic acid mutarotase
LDGALLLATAIAIAGGTLPATAAPRCQPLGGFSAAPLADGRVLVIASGGGEPPTLLAEIYDPTANRWTPASIDREASTVTPLADGRILLIGGNQWCMLGPELYDPKTDKLSPAASMIAPNSFIYTSTLLRSSKVLVTGLLYASVSSAPLAIAELYDPVTNRWSRTGSMNVARKGARAILLADGRVLVVGGANEVGQDQPHSLTSAEIYDPASNTWSTVGGMRTGDGGRYATHTLAPLGNGTALAAGGGQDGMPASTAEVFDPATRSWSQVGGMTYARSAAAATPLRDGRVLVLGGQGISGLPLTTGEIFDPKTSSWALIPATLKTGRIYPEVVPLPNGRILVTSWSDHWSPADVEIFDPTRSGTLPTPTPTPTGPGTWTSEPSTTLPRANHTTTQLADGRVLVLGGGFPGYPPVLSFDAAIAAGVGGEIYDQSTRRWSPTATGSGVSASAFTATLLASGKVLVVGYGARLYDPAQDRWSPAGDMAVTRGYHVAIRLKDGRVLLAGGNTQIPPYDPPVEIYDPSSNTWSTAAQMDPDLAKSPSDTFRAVLLEDGRVFFLNGYTAKAAIFNPTTGTWSGAASPMHGLYSDYTIRAGYRNFSATLLPNGSVLVAGGAPDNGGTVRPEVYNPATNRWSLTPPLLHGRQSHSATLLANGLVLVAGGTDSSLVGGVTATGELYDPTTNRWSLTGSMNVARSGQTATLLKDGRVLVVGGQFLGNLRTVELYTPSDHRHLAGGPPSAGILHGAAIPFGLGALLIVVAAGVLAVRARGRKRPTGAATQKAADFDTNPR